MTESSITERGAPELADTRRRIWAIVGASSGNLVEWFDFYVYSFCSCFFSFLRLCNLMLTHMMINATIPAINRIKLNGIVR